MGRRRGFDETQAVTAAAEVFQRHGYEATSVDDLVAATGVNRASLYNVFGSKYGLFRRALHQQLADPDPGPDPQAAAGEPLDLLLVALIELAPNDEVVRAGIADAINTKRITPARLGARLLQRAGLPVKPTPTLEETHP